MIAFYYGLTGFACVWYFRRSIFGSIRHFLLRGLLPLLGGLMLLAAFLKSAIDMYATDYGDTSFAGVGGVFLTGIGALVLGLILMEGYRLMAPHFFAVGIERSLVDPPTEIKPPLEGRTGREE
jgi:hypothetical protein